MSRLSGEQIQELFRNDPLLWGLMLLNEHLRNKPASFQKEILSAALKYRKLAVVAPREHSKSTILSFLYVMHCIYFHKKKFIVMFSDTKGKAMNFLDRIRIELKENELLGMLYGKPEFTKDSEYELVFTSQVRIRYGLVVGEKMELVILEERLKVPIDLI